MVEGKPVSLWECTNCGAEGIGTVYIESKGWADEEIACDEPEDWWLTSKAILCEECKPE